MAKEWILNSAMNRFQLNFKRNVGPTSESIRKCSPKTLEKWREYYFSNVKPKVVILQLLTEEQAFTTNNDYITKTIKLLEYETRMEKK